MEIKSILVDVCEWLYCIIIALILALTIRYFLGTPTVVKHSSMRDTLEPDQRLVLNRVVKTMNGTIERSDIVTFEAPSKVMLTEDEVNQEQPEAIYKKKNLKLIEKFKYSVLDIGKTSYVKRVIGVAGDHILIEDGSVYLNGEKLEEKYIRKGAITQAKTFYDIVVPEGYIYVMGDNRQESMDSRDFGCIPLNKVESTIFFRFWPLDKFGKID